MEPTGSTDARWPAGLLLTRRGGRWRGEPPGDPRLEALRTGSAQAPTTESLVESLVESARAAGFERIVVQHDAAFADGPPRWDRLRAAGLTGVSLRLEGGDIAQHDFIARQDPAIAVPGLDTLGKEVQCLRELGLSRHVRTRVARSNFRALDSVGARALAWGVRTWTLEYLPMGDVRVPPQGAGHAHPRLAMSLPWVLRAAAHGGKRGLQFAVRGAPLCLLGPMAKHAVEEEPGGFAGVCDACPSRARCVGVDATYLERFGSGELRERDRPTEPSLGWWAVAPLL